MLTLIRSGASRVALKFLAKPNGENLFRSRIVSGPLSGMNLSAPDRETLSLLLGVYEPLAASEILSVLRPGMVAWDVGANVGYLTLIMSRAVGPTGQVTAFEPDPKNILALSANIRDNGLTNATIRAVAVSDGLGRIQFSPHDGHTLVGQMLKPDEPGDFRQFVVAATTLDYEASLVAVRQPDLVKIDVDGAEDLVFRGGRRLFEGVRPTVIAEVNRAEIPRISRMMGAFGYQGRRLDGGVGAAEGAPAVVVFEQLRRSERTHQ